MDNIGTFMYRGLINILEVPGALIRRTWSHSFLRSRAIELFTKGKPEKITQHIKQTQTLYVFGHILRFGNRDAADTMFNGTIEHV